MICRLNLPVLEIFLKGLEGLPGHLEIGMSVCPFVSLSVIQSWLTKCNIQSLGSHTVTKH